MNKETIGKFKELFALVQSARKECATTQCLDAYDEGVCDGKHDALWLVENELRKIINAIDGSE